jgi:hypothetical protein
VNDSAHGLNKLPFSIMKINIKKAGTEYRMIFRQPGCLSKTRRLSAPFLRMVKYYRLSLKHFCASYISIRICQHFSKVQLRGQGIRAKEHGTRKKTIQDMLTQVNKKAKNLIDVLSEGGIASNRSVISSSRLKIWMFRPGSCGKSRNPWGGRWPPLLFHGE